MLDEYKEDFYIMLGQIFSVYGKKLEEISTKVYWEVLKKYEFEEIKKAFYEYISNPDYGQFLPKPADIIRQISGTSEMQALIAWTKVIKCGRVHGNKKAIVFDDYKIHAVIDDMGGWDCFFGNRASRLTEKDFKFMEIEFKKRYEGYCLIPVGDFPNVLNFFPGREILGIGDKKKVEEIYLCKNKQKLIENNEILLLCGNQTETHTN